MFGGTKLVIDSGAQTGDTLVERYGAALVPLTIVVNDEAFLEGVELTNDAFYDRLAGGATVTTAAPSPGQFLAAYREAAAEGASAVLSVHLAKVLSGTVNAARVASEMSPIPVHVLDSDSCAWGVDAIVSAAADALLSGGDIDVAVAAAHTRHERLINVFFVGQPELLQRGGRTEAIGRPIEPTSVFATRHTDMLEVGKVDTVGGLIEAIVDFVAEETRGERVEVAVGDARSSAIADDLFAALRPATDAFAMIRYEMSPSLAAHLGAGSVAVTCCAAR